MGEILDGKKVAAEVRAEVERDVESLRGTTGVTPTLATVLVGDDPGSHLYVSNKEKACRQVGITSEGYRPPAAVSEDELLGCVESLNRRADIHGILVQLPLPPGLDAARVIAAIAPAKDVDGLHPYNQGRLLAGADGLRPCTPLGIMRLIDTAGVTLRGARAAVVGRSTLVGKPVALLLLERHATVTMCHSRTRELAAEVSAADVVVAATGSPGLVRGEWIRPGSVVIDVGINRGPDGRLRGDVEFEAARERAAFITPVPGGVGPMTVAMLLANTVRAARQQLGVAHDG